MISSAQLRLPWGPLYLRLTAVVLGTLSLFGVTVVVLHLAALGHATAPMRAEVLRIVADARAGRDPAAAAESAQVPSALFGPDGRQRSGRPVPRWIRRDLPHLSEGEHCSFLGMCYAVRTVPLADGPGHLVLYQVSAASALAPLSAAFLASVLIWLLASSAAGLVLLSALRRADDSRRKLLAGLAHDLGTPLTSIRGFAETLLAAPSADLDHPDATAMRCDRSPCVSDPGARGA
ncbi:MAG TPA: histidine kinase dimerization/phospho-acceptor domain-containing protein, partial [Vicinamibacteria bacterium]|nr:histidine kinase dimerization/phospho-acceptor domain-containing protein [Vicinamibacteria bacterium]